MSYRLLCCFILFVSMVQFVGAAECSADGSGTLNSVGIKIDNGGSDSRINTVTEALTIHAAWLTAGSPASGLINNGIHNVSASGSSQVDRIDFGGSSHDFSGTLNYPSVSGSDFLVRTAGTLSLPAGSYTIYVEADDGSSFVMDTLYGDTVVFNKFDNVNNSVGTNELRFENTTRNSSTGGSFTLTEDSLFEITAIFFERGFSDYLEVSISNDIRTNEAPTGYEILKHGALNGKVKFGECKVDHFEIDRFNGQGLTCEPDDITIKACVDVACTTIATDDVDVVLSVSDSSDVVLTKNITVIGNDNKGPTDPDYVAVKYTHTTAGVVSLSLNETYTCLNADPTLCDVTFADSGFRFVTDSGDLTLPVQLSGKPSNVGYNADTLQVEAVQTNNVGACAPLLITGESIEMAASYEDPNSGSQNIDISNTSIPKIITSITPIIGTPAFAAYTSVPLDFGGVSQHTAAFIFTYPDAGSMQLYARYQLPDDNGEPSGDYIEGSSNPFIVRPFGFFVDVIDSPSPKAQTAGQLDSAFKKAGEDFTTRLTAVQWQASDDDLSGEANDGVPDSDAILSNNTATVNFGNEATAETATITDSLYLPAAGTEGNLTNNSFISFNNGMATNGTDNSKSMTYDEVGIVKFTANLSDGSYLGASDVIGIEPYVGRFYPDHFTVTSIDNGMLLGACNTDNSTDLPFIYSGQMLSDSLSRGALSYLALNTPSISMEARNKSNTLTTNYSGDFLKLSLANFIRLTPNTDISQRGSDLTNLVGLTATLGTANFTVLNGLITYKYNDDDNFVYLHEANSEIKEFTSKIALEITSIIDDDGVETLDFDSISDNGLILTLQPTGKLIRFGRAQLENSYGSDTSDLPQILSVNYYTDNGYVLSKTDTCTTYTDDNITLSNISLNPTLTPVKDTVSGTFIDAVPRGETQDIILTAPTTDLTLSNIGQVEVIYTVNDWLKYDWAYDDEGVDSLFNDDPRGIATFGLYRGNDRIIYQRETSR